MSEAKSNKRKWFVFGCLIPFGLLLLLGGLGAIFVMNFAKNAVSMDHTQVEAEARGILQYKIPGGSVGQVRMSVAGISIYIIRSKALPTNATLMIAKTPPSKGAGYPEYIEEQIARRSAVRFTTSSLRRVPGRLCGQRVRLTLAEGYFYRGQKKVRVSTSRAIVDLNKDLRFAMVHAIGPGSRARANRIWRSLKCPK